MKIVLASTERYEATETHRAIADNILIVQNNMPGVLEIHQGIRCQLIRPF
jgi:hypothetical protein